LRSLRGRLIAWLLAGTGLLLIVAGLLLDRRISFRLRQDFDADLIAEARSVMAVTEQQGGRVTLELSPDLLPQFEARQAPDYFQIWLPDGRLLARSPSLGGRDLPRPASPSRRFRFAGLTLPDGRRGRRVEITFLPLVEPDDERGGAEPAAGAGSTVTLVVATGSEELDAFLASLHRTLALFILGLLLGSAVLVRVVTALALRPLDDLSRRLEAIDAGSLREPVVIDGAPAELVPTIEHLNGLLARLAGSFERERMFSASLAHELRTPLAELRAVTEVALKWPDDPASLLAALGEARSSGLQMEKIVVNLLALARYDGGQHTLHRSRVPLRETVDACWRAAAAEAAGRGLTAALEIPEGLALVTDREKLELILSNLLANAAAYGSPGGRITCAVSAADGRFRLSVANPTPDLTPDDLPRLFDRFWRRDAARSDGRHVGLGLSLVAALCELLGFSREARLRDGVLEIVLSGPVGS
jgi:two-component system, OmpR family, heavy metal sensor histidine kinase CusS